MEIVTTYNESGSMTSSSLAPALPATQSIDLCVFRVPLDDRPEFAALPQSVKADVEDLLKAFRHVASQKCAEAALRALAASCKDRRGFSHKRLRTRYYEYLANNCDWRVLVNAAVVPAYARKRKKKQGLPREFVEFFKKLGGQNKRKYRPAYKKLCRLFCEGAFIPGYGTWKDWYRQEFPHNPLPPVCPLVYPAGWSYANLMRHLPSKAQETAARIGQAAALEFLPHVLGTRTGLRFLEQVMFDDVKLDFRVFDPVSRQVCDLWILIAHDKATDVRLGYWMLPATAREDGSQNHLKHEHMKKLAGWVLQKWGVPLDYSITWKIENGTATFTEATAKAIEQLSGGRIRVSYSSMINGKSPAGFKERALGNSRAKATLEAGNNLLHNECGDLPAQTGRRYDVRPADLIAREVETRDLVKRMAVLPPELAGRVELPILTVAQARLILDAVLDRINRRTDHACEGFEDILEWRPCPGAELQPIATLPNPQPAGSEVIQRKESPYERMMRLVAGCKWQKVHPSDLQHFFDSEQRLVRVDDRGQIEFKFQGKDLVFANPEATLAPQGRGQGEGFSGNGAEATLAPQGRGQGEGFSSGIKPGDKFLAYFNAQDTSLLHLTHLPPHGGYVASWPQRQRVNGTDKEALAAAIEYTARARKAQMAELHERHADEAAAEEARRERNRLLFAEYEANQQAIDADIVTVAPIPSPLRGEGQGEGSLASAGRTTLPASPVAQALSVLRSARAEKLQGDISEQKRLARLKERADKLLARAAERRAQEEAKSPEERAQELLLKKFAEQP